MKSIIAKLLAKELKKKETEILSILETPPNSELGDFSFPCFSLAKELKKNPAKIAQDLMEKLELPEEIERLEVQGAYLNFFVNKNILASRVIKQILKEKSRFGSSKEGKEKTIVIDMSSPNIAKPFGIGHLRSTIIGNSISEIHKKLGYKVVKINYLGDWGTQFGRLIIGYMVFGDSAEIRKEPIKKLLDIYVKANTEEFAPQAREWFKRLEDGDREALKLWKTFKNLSLKEFKKIYKTLGIKFDVYSGESLYNNKMQATIKELDEKGLLEESEGAKIVDLEKYNLGVCLIQKSDDATLYATRDITAAIDRHKTYKFAKMFYEVGVEQKLHFQQFFKVLELMGYKWAEDLVHIEHGLYLDKDGKKFSTREGKVVFMEDILKETIELARKTIEEKNSNLKNKDEVARKIAIAAIFYGDLKNYRGKDIVFDISKFLDFEGNTGPYLQYSYARASSVIKKSKKTPKVTITDLQSEEAELVKQLALFPQIVAQASQQLNPSLIANYSFQLAQIFNEFYHNSKVIGDDKEEFRLALVESFRTVIKSALSLLGIEVMEEM